MQKHKQVLGATGLSLTKVTLTHYQPNISVLRPIQPINTVKSVLWRLHCTDAGDATYISDVHAASIFRANMLLRP
jgi:hypothetical protein